MISNSKESSKKEIAISKKIGFMSNFDTSRGHHGFVKVIHYDEVCKELIGDVLDKYFPPLEGEYQEIAVFGKWTKHTDTHEYKTIADYSSLLVRDAAYVELDKPDSIIDFLSRHGPLFDYELNYKEQTLIPLWLEARAIVKFNIIRQLCKLLQHPRSKTMIQHTHRLLKRTLSEGETYSHLVDFTLPTIPKCVLLGLMQKGELTIELPFEPEEYNHFIAAAWEFVTMNINLALTQGFLIHVQPLTPSKIIQSLPCITGQQKLNIQAGAFYRKTYCNPHTSNGLFNVSFMVRNNLQLMYLYLLEQFTKGKIQKQCQICGEYFIPETDRYIYCPSHDEPEKRRYRRQLAKQNKKHKN